MASYKSKGILQIKKHELVSKIALLMIDVIFTLIDDHKRYLPTKNPKPKESRNINIKNGMLIFFFFSSIFFLIQ